MIEYFLTSTDKTDFLHYIKSKVLVNICFLGIFLVSIQLMSSVIVGIEANEIGRRVIMPLAIISIFFGDLFFLKYSKNKELPGNFLVMSLLLVQFGFLFYYAPTAGLDYFVSGFYHAMLFFSLSAILSSRSFILANTLFFLVAINLIIFLRTEKVITDPHMIELFNSGKFHFQIVFLIFATIILSVNSINNGAYFQIKKYVKEEEEETAQKKLFIRAIEKMAEVLNKEANSIRYESSKVRNGSSSQAASIEEISASIEEAASALIEVSDNSQRSKQMSEKTSKSINENLAYFQKTADVVANIKKHSEEIEKIAAQTEVLAINAAIEASKTRGLHGGFTVIATEIKKLAENTIQASENIFAYIDKSHEMSQLTSHRVTEINSGLLELNNKMEHVVLAAEEQKQSVYQISLVMNELNSSAQENSAASNQLFEIADKLKELSEMLKDQLQIKA